MLRRMLPLLLLLPLGACATTAADREAAANDANAPAWRLADADGRLVGRAEAHGATAALATAAAVEAARAELTRVVEAEVAALASTLRDSVRDLDDPEALRRFENARHLAASGTLRAAAPPRTAPYLEPAGGFSAVAVLAVDADEPALRLHEQLRRIGRFEDRLAGNAGWESLAERAAARRMERAETPPLPPVSGIVR